METIEDKIDHWDQSVWTSDSIILYVEAKDDLYYQFLQEEQKKAGLDKIIIRLMMPELPDNEKKGVAVLQESKSDYTITIYNGIEAQKNIRFAMGLIKYKLFNGKIPIFLRDFYNRVVGIPLASLYAYKH